MASLFKTRAKRVFVWCLVGALVLMMLGGVNEFLPETRYLEVSHGTGQVPDHPRSPSIIGHIPDLFVAYRTAGGLLYGTSDHFVFRSSDDGQTFERLGMLPEKSDRTFDRWIDLIARSKPVRFIRKNPGPTNLVVLNSGTVLVVGAGAVYRSEDGGHSFAVAYDFEENAVFEPFTGGVAVTPDDQVFFGEYVADDTPRAIRILEGLEDGTVWKIAHTFAKGEVRHVHSIRYDTLRDVLWVCTGDTDEQSKILFSADGLESLHTLGTGSQDWRVVSVLPTARFLYWGSDTGRIDGSNIFRFDFLEQRLERLAFIGKPSFSATSTPDGILVLSTAFQPESDFALGRRPDPSAEIWTSSDGADWKPVFTAIARVDQDDLAAFRARLLFPNGAPGDVLVANLLDTQQFRGYTLLMRLPDNVQ